MAKMNMTMTMMKSLQSLINEHYSTNYPVLRTSFGLIFVRLDLGLKFMSLIKMFGMKMIGPFSNGITAPD